MEKRGISKLDLKRRNRMQILRIIREYGPISRVDVASALEITRAAVTIITNEMIEEGVLVEIGEAPINAEKLQKGRRKILIDINVNSRFALGATVDEKENIICARAIYVSFLATEFVAHCLHYEAEKDTYPKPVGSTEACRIKQGERGEHRPTEHYQSCEGELPFLAHGIHNKVAASVGPCIQKHRLSPLHK